MQKKIMFGIIIISLLAASAFSQDKKNPPPQTPQPQKEGEPMPPPPPSPDFPGPHKQPETYDTNNPPDPHNPQNPPKREDFYNFRGVRKNITDFPIEVMNATFFVPHSKKNKSGELELCIRFNQSINPKSCISENILINEEETPYEGQIIFSKSSDSVTLMFDDEQDAQKISQVEFRNIVSMDGKRCDILVIKSIKIKK